MNARIEKHYFEEGQYVFEGDTLEYKMSNMVISVKGLEGILVGYRKVYDEDNNLIAIMPLLKKD